MYSKNMVRLASLATKHAVSLGTVATLAEMQGLGCYIIGGGGRGKVRYIPEDKAKILSDILDRKKALSQRRKKATQPNQPSLFLNSEMQSQNTSVSPNMTYQQMADHLKTTHGVTTSYKDIYRIYTRIADELKTAGLAKSEHGKVLLAVESAGTFQRHISSIKRRPNRKDTVQDLKNKLPHKTQPSAIEQNLEGSTKTIDDLSTACEQLAAGLQSFAKLFQVFYRKLALS